MAAGPIRPQLTAELGSRAITTAPVAAIQEARQAVGTAILVAQHR